MKSIVTTALDVAGAGCLMVFAALVWRPEAALLVLGVALLLVSWRRA